MSIDKTASDLVNIIRDIVREELSHTDNTIVCQVASVNADGTYDLYIVSDMKNIIRQISSITSQSIKVGDFVNVYKIKNQLNNAFILNKIGR